MAHYKLHCNGGSGNSYKLALYLNCAGLDWQPIGVDFAGGQTRDPGWRAGTNVMGEVPVLEVDGQRMSQSGAILIWLAETTGKFAPIGADERFQALRWILFDNHKFTNNYAMHRFQHSLTPVRRRRRVSISRRIFRLSMPGAGVSLLCRAGSRLTNSCRSGRLRPPG
jgi:glutathione S-transferase